MLKDLCSFFEMGFRIMMFDESLNAVHGVLYVLFLRGGGGVTRRTSSGFVGVDFDCFLKQGFIGS